MLLEDISSHFPILAEGYRLDELTSGYYIIRPRLFQLGLFLFKLEEED